MLPIHRLYADQVVANARIAFLKHRAFDVAIWIALAAVATPLGALAVYLVTRPGPDEDGEGYAIRKDLSA